jgi:hypothetical protein
MPTRTHTGGNIDFESKGETYEDTAPTEKFKEEYEKYMAKPKWQRKLIRFYRWLKSFF